MTLDRAALPLQHLPHPDVFMFCVRGKESLHLILSEGEDFRGSLRVRGIFLMMTGDRRALDLIKAMFFLWVVFIKVSGIFIIRFLFIFSLI